MTLETLYNTWQGKSVPSPDGQVADAGQCVSWADAVLNQVYGQPYLYANAIDWWQNPQLATVFDFIPYAPGIYPKAGDFVIWGTGVGSQYGHVDTCAQDGTASGFVGYDSNWEDTPILRTVQHNYAYGILGYIRFKGEDMKPVSEQVPDDTTAQLLFQQLYGGNPTRTDLNFIEEFTVEGYLRWVASDPNHAEIMAKGLAPTAPTNFVPYSGAQLYISK